LNDVSSSRCTLLRLTTQSANATGCALPPEYTSATLVQVASRYTAHAFSAATNRFFAFAPRIDRKIERARALIAASVRRIALLRQALAPSVVPLAARLRGHGSGLIDSLITGGASRPGRVVCWPIGDDDSPLHAERRPATTARPANNAGVRLTRLSLRARYVESGRGSEMESADEVMPPGFLMCRSDPVCEGNNAGSHGPLAGGG
jgi:hypothetical protein